MVSSFGVPGARAGCPDSLRGRETLQNAEVRRFRIGGPASTPVGGQDQAKGKDHALVPGARQLCLGTRQHPSRRRSRFGLRRLEAAFRAENRPDTGRRHWTVRSRGCILCRVRNLTNESGVKPPHSKKKPTQRSRQSCLAPGLTRGLFSHWIALGIDASISICRPVRARGGQTETQR